MSSSSGLYEIKATRSTATTEIVLTVRSSARRHHEDAPTAWTSERVDHEGTAQATGIKLMIVEWGLCIECFHGESSHMVPKTTDNRAVKRTGRFFIELARGMHVPSLGGSKYVLMVLVDN